MGAGAVGVGIAIQNFPRVRLHLMPRKLSGVRAERVLRASSGAAAAVRRAVHHLLAGYCAARRIRFQPAAARQMIHVVVEELIPRCAGRERRHSNIGTSVLPFGFIDGDVALMSRWG